MILVLEISTLVISIMITLCSGPLLKMTGGNRNGMERLGQSFMILGIVVSITMIVSVAVGIKTMQTKLIFTLTLCFIMGFFVIDT